MRMEKGSEVITISNVRCITTGKIHWDIEIGTKGIVECNNPNVSFICVNFGTKFLIISNDEVKEVNHENIWNMYLWA